MSSERAILRRGAALTLRALRDAPFGFSLGGGAAALWAGMTVLSATVLGEITDRVLFPALRTGDTTAGALALSAAAILVVSAVKAAGIFGRRYGAYHAQYELQADYRTRVTRQYLALPIEWHRRHATGELLSNANADVEAAFFIAAPLPMSMGAVLMLGIAAVLLILTDPFLAAIGFVVGPAVGIVNWYYQRRQRRAARLAQQSRADVSEIAHESFDAALVVKTLGRERAETRRFRDEAERLRDRMIEVGRIRALFDPVVEALPSIGILLVLLVGAWRAQAGALTPGDLVEFAFLFRLLALPMRVFGWFLGELPRALVGWERIETVLDAEGRVTYGDTRVDGDGAAAVALDGVDYRHPEGGREDLSTGRRTTADGAGETRGVEDVELVIEPGTTVAVVGPTGAGKSTIASLLVRLFDPDDGRIVLDGTDLPDVDRHDLADSVAMVFQDAFLFDDTVRGNITLGRDHSAEEVEQAARLARAHEFVTDLEQGYETVVGERGASLSGGQRQRVALARALIRGPRLLVLDDATSAVDPAVESAILDNLRDAALPATVVVVAYRVSSIALADEVVFVKDGTIAAVGGHDDLMAREPDYAGLITAYDEVGG